MKRTIERLGWTAAMLGALALLSMPAFADGHDHGGAFRGGGGGGPHAVARGSFAAPSGRHFAPGARGPGGEHWRGVARPGYTGHGYEGHGIRYGNPRAWHGGYSYGRYWPRAYYRSGYSLFLPVLPAIYSTFWFGGIPYYYADDLYYTWSPDEAGYVVTTPPPAADAASGDDNADDTQSGAQIAPATTVYAYPKNGQSAEQTATDQFQCHQWAVGQTGFNPTHGADQSPTASSAADYRRAQIACLEGRGYSAK